MHELVVRTFVNQETIIVNRYPDICPHCNNGIVPQYLSGFKGSNEVFLTFYCSINSCKEFFVGKYDLNPSGRFWNFYYTLLGYPILTKFPPSIKRVSPLFSEIYNQAEIAQKNKLDQICGMGFRKSLEFLIKDYIISKGIANEVDVKKAPLGDCIKRYIENKRIKDNASRAAWLGNDETHYVRKWEAMDVENLKTIIKLTVSWIEMEAISDELDEVMPVPEK